MPYGPECCPINEQHAQNECTRDVNVEMDVGKTRKDRIKMGAF